jgi:hypothetical protein
MTFCGYSYGSFMKRDTVFLRFLAAVVGVIFSISSFAQRLPDFEDIKAGDVIQYSLKIPGKSESFEYQITEASSLGLKGLVVRGMRSNEFTAPQNGYLEKEFCFVDGQKCSWSPAVKFFDGGMKVGDKWKSSYVVTTEEALVDQSIEHKVEKFEKIKIKLGEFETYRVFASGPMKATLFKNNEVFKGSLKMTYWVGVFNKRLVILKREYSNDFRQSFSQELQSVTVKSE